MSHPVRVRGLKLVVTSGEGLDVVSHPVRVRGLKRNYYREKVVTGNVAPRAGAWVETSPVVMVRNSAMSHPVRVRGLKLYDPKTGKKLTLSHPVRVRGLKRDVSRNNSLCNRVAPRAGAWVETHAKRLVPHGAGRRTPCGCVG